MMGVTVEFLREHIFELPDIIFDRAIAIYVYGSVARRDADADSDCDLLVCIEDCDVDEYFELKQSVSTLNEHIYEFAFYQLSTLREMQKKGSYFLWHIKEEAVLLYQRDERIQHLLDVIPKYTRTKDDFCEYNEILLDIEQSLTQDDATIEYDLSTLAVLARNICIGCCYLLGDMDFGRITPIIKCANYWEDQFPFTLSEYNALYEFRFALVRQKQIDQKAVSQKYAEDWLDKLRKLLELAFSL